MIIADQKVVLIHYKLTADDGEILDQSEESSPLAYLHGQGNLIAGLEAALLGRTAGDKFSVRVEPESAYGERDERLIQAVPRHAFEGVESIEPGMRFYAETPDGGTQMVTVLEVVEDEVILDGNHPMAGVPLNFDVEVMEVRDATDAELAHGHVHGPGGHHHH